MISASSLSSPSWNLQNLIFRVNTQHNFHEYKLVTQVNCIIKNAIQVRAMEDTVYRHSDLEINFRAMLLQLIARLK
jgi:hypothetical protein